MRRESKHVTTKNNQVNTKGLNRRNEEEKPNKAYRGEKKENGRSISLSVITLKVITGLDKTLQSNAYVTQ